MQPEVSYCYHCQPREGGEMVWVAGERMEIEDLLRSFDVPESALETVAKRLSCRNCGTRLELGVEIGRREPNERAYDDLYDEWRRRYLPQLKEFEAWVSRFPYLGAHHRLGRKFLKEISEFPIRGWTEPETWWRGRAVVGSDVPKPSDMGPPRVPPKCEGRYNHHGQIVFYLAATKEVAAAEALGKAEGVAWVQPHTVGPVERILDLNATRHPDEMLGLPVLAAGMNWTRAHVTEAGESEWRPQYFLPRFIADCARASDFKGIVYPSTRFYGECLVLFEWVESSVRSAGDPILIQWNKKQAEDEMPF